MPVVHDDCPADFLFNRLKALNPPCTPSATLASSFTEFEIFKIYHGIGCKLPSLAR